MCDYCNSGHSCCEVDEDTYSFPGDEFCDDCSICNICNNYVYTCDSVNDEDQDDYCDICDVEQGINMCNDLDYCELCNIRINHSSNDIDHYNPPNNIKYLPPESTPTIVKHNYGCNFTGNIEPFKNLNKKKSLKFCKKEVTCLTRTPKCNISVLPLAQGSKNLELIAKRVKPKSSSKTENGKSFEKNKISKIPKIKISTPK